MLHGLVDRWFVLFVLFVSGTPPPAPPTPPTGVVWDVIGVNMGGGWYWKGPGIGFPGKPKIMKLWFKNGQIIIIIVLI